MRKRQLDYILDSHPKTKNRNTRVNTELALSKLIINLEQTNYVMLNLFQHLRDPKNEFGMTGKRRF